MKLYTSGYKGQTLSCGKLLGNETQAVCLFKQEFRRLDIKINLYESV